MILRRFSILFLGGCLLLRAAELKPEDARESALSAWKAGKHQEAVALVSQAITANPKDARLLNMRAQMRRPR